MRLYAVLATSTLFFASPVFSQGVDPSSASVSSPAASLEISQPTEAPGLSLSRGSYSIRVSDRLQDRLIVQIQKNGSKSFSSLLGYPNPALRGGSFTGPVIFASGLKSKPTLRGYAFPGGPVVEFVFPKKDAVELAKSNNVRVMAVDTASEGRVSLPNLTQTDMSEVTLWMLTPTPVDPATAKPGIQAARYQAPATSASAPAAPAQPAAPATPAAPAYSASSEASAAEASAPSPATHTKPAVAKAPVLVASNHPPRLRPNVKQLPHTASNLPLIALTGCASLFTALLLTVRRKMFNL